MVGRLLRMAWVGLGGALLLGCGSMVERGAQSLEGLPPATDSLTTTANLGQTAFRATVVATLRQPVTSTRTGLAMFWHRSREVVVGNVPVSMSLMELPEEQPGTEAFERFLDGEGLPKRELGRVKCLVDGPGFFGEFDRQLEKASRSVDVQIYIFDNDDIGVRYAQKLARKSSTVPVRVLFDDMGTNTAIMAPPLTPAPDGFLPPEDMKACLKDGSNVAVRRTLNPWLVADHTKLLVFDDKTAILGGMNIGREYYSEWHDLMLKVEGPIVGSLAREFQSAWRKAGPWGDLAGLFPGRKIQWPDVVGNDVPLRILRTDAPSGRSEVLEASIAAMRASRERIWIQNPYFASDDLARAAQDAARRGVDVRVIFPLENDSRLMELSNLETARGLISAGVKVYHYPVMTHLKAMICDGWATVGSANFDVLSMRLNRELNLAFSDERSVADLADSIFLPDFRRSKRVKLEDTESPMAPFVESVADQL
ncbi:phosphatidylserine/phosphatidylglycerophosphate/cardiolipin synthase family protein [Haloferula chungangensis]|uniref:Phosphatidylserine/phosphatidylglycerophosphate/ cardiolipin synthase family protein n=1 Tax=Haloferula chungangensis TaxID=1048331 RepID=A0ABW2L4I4_9BACT